MGARSLRRGKRRSMRWMLSTRLSSPGNVRARNRQHMLSRSLAPTEALFEPDAQIASEQTRQLLDVGPIVLQSVLAIFRVELKRRLVLEQSSAQLFVE